MPRRTREIWRNLIGQFERSGKTQEQFAAEREIPLTTLRAWIYRLRREQEEEDEVDRVVVDVVAEDLQVITVVQRVEARRRRRSLAALRHVRQCRILVYTTQKRRYFGAFRAPGVRLFATGPLSRVAANASP